MSLCAEQVRNWLNEKSVETKAISSAKFFKTGKGKYGEGDKFLGVTVPEQRKLAKSIYQEISLEEISGLLKDEYHEVRLTAVFVLVYKYQKHNTQSSQKEVVDFYLAHLNFINNWDLVDSSCSPILGHYYHHRSKSLFYQLADTGHLWSQRVAMVSALYWIKQGEFEDALGLASKLIFHKHDLIQKAVGWMLREIGKKNMEVAQEFLKKYYRRMPRTTLRYAIEKFDAELRKKILMGTW